MILEEIKYHDIAKLEGQFYSLYCLCHDMQYIENEDLLNVVAVYDSYLVAIFYQ